MGLSTFTQEITGSNPVGGLHFSIARTGRHSAGSRRVRGPAPGDNGSAVEALVGTNLPLRVSVDVSSASAVAMPVAVESTMSWSPETNPARPSYPQITHPRRETASEARILPATLSWGGPPCRPQANRGYPTLAAAKSRPAQRRGPGRCTRERLSAGGVSTARAARARPPHTHDIDETRAPGTTIPCPTTAPTISLGTSAPHIRPKDQSQCQQSDQTPL
jgi:hypothetical protein